MTILRQIEITQNNIEDLGIQIQDCLECVDRVLNEVPGLIEQRAAQRRHLNNLFKVRVAELQELERFADPEAAERAADIEMLFGPEIADESIRQNRQRPRE
jgi:hypothetical protein